jgi:23S rRNA (guanosine2251-2'-O)-methyltransferase
MATNSHASAQISSHMLNHPRAPSHRLFLQHSPNTQVSVPLADVLANPPVVVLDNVCNAENIGSILRTAYCLGVTSVVASPTAWSALRDTRAARTSMGTVYFHRMHLADDMLSTLDQLKSGGLSLYAAEIGPGAVPLRAHGPDRRWAVVLGNEDRGVSEEIQQRCDAVMMIPQASGDSLNVGHASAIALFVLGSQSPLPHHDGGGKCT